HPIAEGVGQRGHRAPAGAMPGRDGIQSELLEIIDGLRNHRFIGAGQVQSAEDRVKRHIPDFERINSGDHQKSSLSWTAAMPALAHASSASPPGAPDTPTAPTVAPAASTRTPPPRMTAPGRSRKPACGMPGWLMPTRSVVLVRKLTAVQPLPAAV